MTLAEFIRHHSTEILREWENFAMTLPPFNEGTERRVLQDHAIQLLNFIAEDIGTSQSSDQQSSKSKGNDLRAAGAGDSAAEAHANTRFYDGFDMPALVAEFRALRASVLRLWRQSGSKQAPEEALRDVTRFNEAVDQALAESVLRYSDRMALLQETYIATIVHDLRNPLGTIANTGELLLIKGEMHEMKRHLIAAQIGRSVTRVSNLLMSLVDVIHVRLGQGLPLHVERIDLQATGGQIVTEIEAQHRMHKVEFTAEGVLVGEWDQQRMQQLLSNLLGNAAQHGATGSPLRLAMRGGQDAVMISVHNQGAPIPAELLPTLFEAMSRGEAIEQQNTTSTSLGLGLFISKEIVDAHNGTITVNSTEEAGTTFTVTLPRKFRANLRA